MSPDVIPILNVIWAERPPFVGPPIDTAHPDRLPTPISHIVSVVFCEGSIWHLQLTDRSDRPFSPPKKVQEVP
eukprot:scaffold43752_cov51-Attheya_sp.AAC.9